jgi:putative hydrolase of the HAD superfamily
MTATETHALARRIQTLSRPLQPQPTGAPTRLPRLPPIRAVLFDIYGTLMISASGDIGLAGDGNEASAFAQALAAADISGADKASIEQGATLLKSMIREQHQARIASGTEYPEIDILVIWQNLIKQLNLVADISQLKRLAVEYECRVNPVWPMPGLADLLEELRSTDLALGIVSNAQFYTPLLFPALLGRDLSELGFAAKRCIWSYRLLEAKPSTRLYAAALAPLAAAGIEAKEVLYIGNDQRNDIWPAAQLGCRTALFAGDKRSLRWREEDPRCQHVFADAVITELAQIPRLLHTGQRKPMH